MEQREKFSSRLGFLFISAGCAIGLGNVWRFPYIVGKYGGAAFVLVYLFFLLVLGIPIMVMEFSVGRASQKSVAASFQALEPKGSRWHLFSYFAMVGNYLLMMFYTTVAGWMLQFLWGTATGGLEGLSASQVKDYFAAVQANTPLVLFWVVVVVAMGFGICVLGLQNGVEKITKGMMTCLFAVMLVLAVRSVTLSGAGEGLAFYLLPDFSRMGENGIGEAVFAAMGQAFFTLSIGMGGMAIFGSYIGRERSLMGESVSITLLDTAVAVIAGLIIFPACFAFGVEPGSGPSLLFVTLPNVFNAMPAGRLWGSLFFVFMTFAALSTVVGVFENIVSFAMDLWHWNRKKAVAMNFFLVILLSLPCILGYSLWRGFTPFGPDTAVLDLEDFLVTNNLMPLGSLVYVFFCVTRYGWGWDNFIAEADAGQGMKFPARLRPYLTFVLPVIVVVIFVGGYVEKFF